MTNGIDLDQLLRRIRNEDAQVVDVLAGPE